MPTTTRRDFLTVSASAFATVGAAIAAWPFLDQMNPDSATKALSTTEVDLAPIPEGSEITVLWRGKAVFVRHRIKSEIAAARNADQSSFTDRYARNASLAADSPATDANRTVSGHEQWLIVIANCTHAGCVPRPANQSVSLASTFTGWKCPCHYSTYDTAGRVTKGPAPRNLDVPPYRFTAPNRILIG